MKNLNLKQLQHRLGQSLDKLRICEIASHGCPLNEHEAAGLSGIISNVIDELEALENILSLQPTADSAPLILTNKAHGLKKGRPLALVQHPGNGTHSQPPAA
jgi:hypothetical protein